MTYGRTAQRALLATLLALPALAACGGHNDDVDAERSPGAVMRTPKGGSGGAPGAPGAPGYPGDPRNCGYTQGFWKNHPEAWPVAALTLGQKTYSKQQLLDILHTPVKGNGLVSMAHQLIAARLNLAQGASPVGLEATLARADALIGALVVPPVGTGALDPAVTSQTNDELTAFNEGKTGPGHCSGNPPGKPPTPPVDAGAPPVDTAPPPPPVVPPQTVE